jgi:hypothetical protein
MLMDEARKHLPPKIAAMAPEELFAAATPEQYYGFTNEREFVAEAFSREEFQRFLAGHQAPRELVKALGMEKKLTLWQSFVHAVRQMLGLPDTR